MKVEAELKVMYKITVGESGVCMGQYYPEDEWEESYYNDNIKELATTLSEIYPHSIPKSFSLEEVEVLIYDDKKYDYRVIKYYNKWSKISIDFVDEYKEFMIRWKALQPERTKHLEIVKKKKEREDKLKQMEENKKFEQKELEKYLKLKEKFDKN